MTKAFLTTASGVADDRDVKRVRAVVVGFSPVRREPSDVMTVDEAAKFLRVGKNQLYDAIGRAEVPHIRVGKTIRLSRTALAAWMRGDA